MTNPGAKNPLVLVIMGVSGSGKTTIALNLAARLGWPFQEGDALHSVANVAKMHAGIPLTDDDRRPWLEAVAAWIDDQRAQSRSGIITCSALTRAYRAMIVGHPPGGPIGISARQFRTDFTAAGSAAGSFHAGVSIEKSVRYT